MVSQRNGTKWIIKKLKDSDSAESEPKMSRVNNIQYIKKARNEVTRKAF